jgi:amidophosphoribosyltransferase
LGAKEVHWIVGFPPVQHKCHLGVSLRTHEELIAARQHGDPKKIARELGAKSVNYISHVGFIRARLLSGKITVPENEKEIFLRNGGCGGCITGIYPVEYDGKHFSEYTHMQKSSNSFLHKPFIKKRPIVLDEFEQVPTQTTL